MTLIMVSNTTTITVNHIVLCERHHGYLLPSATVNTTITIINVTTSRSYVTTITTPYSSLPPNMWRRTVFLLKVGQSSSNPLMDTMQDPGLGREAGTCGPLPASWDPTSLGNLLPLATVVSQWSLCSFLKPQRLGWGIATIHMLEAAHKGISCHGLSGEKKKYGKASRKCILRTCTSKNQGNN